MDVSSELTLIKHLLTLNTLIQGTRMSSPTQLCTVPPNDSYLHPEPFDGSDEVNEDNYDVKVHEDTYDVKLNEDSYDIKVNEDTYDVKIKIFDAQAVLTETDQQKHFQHLREAVPNAKENHSVYPSEPTSEPHPGYGYPRYSPEEPSVRGSEYLSKRKRSLTDSAGGPVSPVEDLSVKKEKNNPAKCGDFADRTRQSNRRQWSSEDEMNPSYSPPSGEISQLPNAQDAVHSGTMAESSDASPRLYSQDDECPRQWSPSEDHKHRSPNDSRSRDISPSLNSQDDKSQRQWSPYIRLPQDSGHMKALHQDHQIRASSFPYDPNPVLWGQETTKLTSSSGVDVSGLDSPYAQNEVMSPQTTPGILYPRTPSTPSNVRAQGIGVYEDNVGEGMKNPLTTKHSQTQDDPIKLNPAITKCSQTQTQEDPIIHRKNDSGLGYSEIAVVVTTHDSPIKDPVYCSYPVPSRSHDSGLENTPMSPMNAGKPKANQKGFQRTGDSPVTISIPDTNSPSQDNAKHAVFGTPCSVVNTSYFLAFTHPSIYSVASQVTGNRIHPGVQVLDHYTPFGAATRMPLKQIYAPAASGYNDALYPNLKPPQTVQRAAVRPDLAVRESFTRNPLFGAMTRTSPYQSPVFGAVTRTLPYQSPEFGAMTRTSPYQSPDFGAVTRTSAYQSPEFGAVPRTLEYRSPEFGALPRTLAYQSPESGAVTRTSLYQSPELGARTRTSPYQSPEFGALPRTLAYQSPEFGSVTRTSPYRSPEFGAVTRTSPYQSPEFGAVTRTSPYQSPELGAMTRTSPYQSPELGAMTRTSVHQSLVSMHIKASSSANYHLPTLKSSAIQGTEIGHPSPVQVNPERGRGLEIEQLSKSHIPDLYRQARTLHPNLLATRTPRMSYPFVSDVRPSARVAPKIPSNPKRPSTQTGLLSTQICTHPLHSASNVIPNTLEIQNPVGFLGRHGAAGSQVRHPYSAPTSISEGRHALVKLLHGYQVHHQEDARAQTPQQDIEGGDFARNAPVSNSEKMKVDGDGIKRDMEIPHVPPQIQQHTAFYPPYVPQAHYKPIAVKHDLVSKKAHSSSQNQNLQSIGSRTFPIVSDVRPSARVVPTTLPNPRIVDGYEEGSFPRHAAMFRKGTQVLSPTPTTHQGLYPVDGGTRPCNMGEGGQLKQDSPSTRMYPEFSEKSSTHSEIFEDLGMEPKNRKQRMHPIDSPALNNDSFLHQDLNNTPSAQNSQYHGKYNPTRGIESTSQHTVLKPRLQDYPGTTTLSVQGHPGNKPPTLSERAQGYPVENTPSGYYLPGSTIRHPVSYSYPSRNTLPTNIEPPFMKPRTTLPANNEPPYMNPINTLPTSIELPFLHTAPVPRDHSYPVTNSQYEHCGSSKPQACPLPSNQDQCESKKVSPYVMSNSRQNKSRKQGSRYDDLFQPLVQMATSSALGHCPARTLKPTSSAKRHRSSVDIKLHVPNQTNVVAEPHKGNEGQLGVSMEMSPWCGDQNVQAHTPTTDLKEESKIKDEDHLPMPMESSHWCHDENVPAHMPTSDPKEEPTKKHGDQLAVPMESSHWCRDPNVPAHMSTSDPKEKKVEEVMHDKQSHEKIMKVEDVLQDQQDHGKIMTVEDMVHDQQDHRKIMKVEDVVHGQQDHGKIMILEDGIHDQQDYEMIKDTENEIQDQKDNADLLDSEDKKLSQHDKKKLLEAVDVIIDLKDQAKLPESEDVNSNQDDKEELLETEDVNSEEEDNGRQLEADDVLIDLKSQPKLLESEDVNSYQDDIEKLLEADNVILDLKDQTKLLEAEDVNTYQDDKEILLEFDDVFIEKDQTKVLESEDVNNDQDDKERLLEADDVILGLKDQTKFLESEDLNSDQDDKEKLFEADDVISDLKDQTKFLESEEVNNDQDDKGKLEADNVFILEDQTKLLESEDERNQDDKENLLEADDVIIDLEDQTKLFETKDVNSDKDDKEKLLEDDDGIIDLKDQTKFLESRQLDDVVDVFIDLKDQTTLLESEDVNFDQDNKKKLLEADDVITDLKDQTKFFEALAITSDIASEMTTPGTSYGTDKPSKLGVDPVMLAADNQAQLSESDEEEIVEEEMMKIKVGANFNSLVFAGSDQVDFFWIFERLCLGVTADQRNQTKVNDMEAKLIIEEEMEAKLESVKDEAKLENEEEMEAKLEKEEDEAKLKMEEEMEAKLDMEEEIVTQLEMNEDTEPKFEMEENKGEKLEPEEDMDAKYEMEAKLVMDKEIEAKIEIEEEMEAKFENEEEMEAKLETDHTHSGDNACIFTSGVTVSCSVSDSESVEYNYNQKQLGQSQGELLSSDTTSEVAVFSSANDSESVKYSNQTPPEQSQEEVIVETGSDTTSELVDHNNKQKQLVQSQKIVTVETGSDPTCELEDYSNKQKTLGQSQEETCSDPTSELVDRSNKSQEDIIVEICSDTTSEMVVLSSANDSVSLDHSNEQKPLAQSQEVVMVETGSGTTSELVDHIIEPKPPRQSLEETIVETDSDTTSELMHHSYKRKQPRQSLEEIIVETGSDPTSELVDHNNKLKPLGQSQEEVIVESGSDIPSPSSSVSDETLDAMEITNRVNDANPDASLSLDSIYLDNVRVEETEQESRELDVVENNIQEGRKLDDVESKIQGPLNVKESTNRVNEANPGVSLSLDSIYLDNVRAGETEQESRELDVVENDIQEGRKLDDVERTIQDPLDAIESTNRVNDVNPDVSVSLDAVYLDIVEAKHTMQGGGKLDVIENRIPEGRRLVDVERKIQRPLGRSRSLPRSRIPRGQYQLGINSTT